MKTTTSLIAIFADCSKLTLQAFPAGLKKIGAYAFKDCKALRGLTVPQGLGEIGRGAFKGSALEVAEKPGNTDCE